MQQQVVITGGGSNGSGNCGHSHTTTTTTTTTGGLNSSPTRHKRVGLLHTSEIIPHYELSLEVKTVRDLWVEYTVGWKGGPAVKELNERYESR